MAYEKRVLRRIYDSTTGRCHLCRKKLSLTNYGSAGERGAWEVDHSKPRANGGTDRANNLLPACLSCNRSKQNSNNRVIREALHGHARRPLSKTKHKEVRTRNAVLGALGGLGLGTLVLGPVGTALASLAGGALGYNVDPE